MQSYDSYGLKYVILIYPLVEESQNSDYTDDYKQCLTNQKLLPYNDVSIWQLYMLFPFLSNQTKISALALIFSITYLSALGVLDHVPIISSNPPTHLEIIS